MAETPSFSLVPGLPGQPSGRSGRELCVLPSQMPAPPAVPAERSSTADNSPASLSVRIRCQRRRFELRGDPCSRRLRSQIDRVWDAFWSGGISNPLEVIEQITYLLFLRRLDDEQTLEENKANRLGQPIERHIFPAGNDDRGRPYSDLRWSRFKNLEPREMYDLVS